MNCCVYTSDIKVQLVFWLVRSGLVCGVIRGR